MSSKNTENSQDKSSFYIFNVSSHIHSKVDHLIYMLKKLTNSKLNQQKWVLDAINEKIQKNENESSQKISMIREKKLHVKLDKNISDILEKEVQNAKKFRRSFSKKLWILEAIHEKIDRDEEKLKTLLDEMKK